MTLKTLAACFFFACAMTSCIQDEAPNSEADIESCTLPGDVLSRSPIIENNEIRLMIKPEAPLHQLAPEFTLTPGATIEPASGTERDYTKQQAYTYTVTSEDGKWQKVYTVKVFIYTINTDYHFEHFKLHQRPDGKEDYYVFYEKNNSGDEIMTWASGNEGFAFTGVEATPVEYPTTVDAMGKNDNCLKLQTRSTGKLGESVGMPLAAGNLFMGSFKINLADVLSATKFGVQFTHKPTFLRGWYKFKAGETFYELDQSTSPPSLKPVTGKKDMCDIYGVFYKTDANLETLTGHNVLDMDNPNIISLARIKDAHETNGSDWVRFDLPFEMLPGRTIDEKKLKAGDYNIAVVFSSSIRGAYFEGAPGSTLWIDEVELDYEGK